MNRKSVAWEVVLAVWCLAAAAATGFGQEMPDELRRPEADLGTTPAVRTAANSHGESSWSSPETEAFVPRWSRRIARLFRGRTQLEGGYSYLRESTNGVTGTQHAVPDMMLRIGLTNRWELRVGWPGWVSSDVDDPVYGGRLNGTLDPSVGFAYDLWSQSGVLPQTGVLVAVPVTLEGNPFTLQSLQPLTELMYAWQTGERTMLTGRSGFAIFDNAGDHYTQFQQSLSLDVLLTERLGAFVTWDMLASHGASDDTSEHMAGGGLSLLLTERCTVSCRAAFGINPDAPDFLNDVRFAYRF